MIFAVCEAFKRRDIADAWKWEAVTDIERRFRRPNNNSVDAEYHRARRKALLAAEKSDQRILNFDCFNGMREAYERGARSAKSPADAHRGSSALGSVSIVPSATP